MPGRWKNRDWEKTFKEKARVHAPIASNVIRKRRRRKPIIDSFYDSPEWKRTRYAALKHSRGVCECCGAGPQQGAVLNVDHIRPRKTYPDLELVLSNLQVLCASCNAGKANSDATDWRLPRGTG